MPKIKMPRNSPALDMTPMVDLAFLLVTFFILTSSFRPEEPVVVDTPSSLSTLQPPNTNMMMIEVDSAGRVFFDIDQVDVRRNTLMEMGTRYGVKFTEDELFEYGRLQVVGVPIVNMPAYLDAKDDKRKEMSNQFKGIPMDTANTLKNELFNWVEIGRRMSYNKQESLGQKNKLRFAIKADGKADYKKVKKVIDMFQSDQVKVNSFNMITDLKKGD